MNASIMVLLAYIAWILILVLGIGVYRTLLVMRKERAPNGFKSDGSDSPAFGQRLARAYGNCVESFAFIGGTLLVALATDSSVITNPLAYVLLVARIGQSIVHLVSTSILAVQVRFAFFVVQVVICLYWVVLMIQKFAG